MNDFRYGSTIEQPKVNLQRRSRPQDRLLRSKTLPWVPGGSNVGPRTKDFASTGPRSLRSGGTLPKIRGTLFVGRRCIGVDDSGGLLGRICTTSKPAETPTTLRCPTRPCSMFVGTRRDVAAFWKLHKKTKTNVYIYKRIYFNSGPGPQDPPESAGNGRDSRPRTPP